MRNLRLAPILVVAMLLAGCTLFFPGCASSQSSYKTLAAVGGTVDAAMKTYAGVVVAGGVSQANQEKVRALHGRYQPLFAEAVRAARFDLQSAAPEEIATLAAEIATLVLTITQNR